MNKICTKCNKEYPATKEYFRGNLLGKFGLSAECKTCLTSRWKSIPQQQKQKYNENKRNWINSNPDKKEERKKYRKEYDKKNPEIVKKMKKSYYERHKEYIIKKVKEYRETHPGYSKIEKEKNAEKHSKRRARKILTGGNFTKYDVRERIDKQNGLCFYCKSTLVNYHVDHYIPLAKGGDNSPSNIVVACPSCNLKKGDLMPDIFMEKCA
jgi:5-methylcytosine-specific restriction endonuclease McrA